MLLICSLCKEKIIFILLIRSKKDLICSIEKRSTFLFGLFIAISALHLWGQINTYSLLASISKALIIPSLGLWAFTRYKPSKQYGFALFFSWLGDVLLIPDGTGFFIAGIAAFWVTQIFYCRLMLLQLGGNFLQQFNKRKAILPLLLLGGYLLFFLIFMSTRLGMLQLPVSLYATTLGMTGFLGIMIARENTQKQAKTLALGTLLFLLSDSMIAFDAFYFEQARFTYWIMATYIPAQYCIAKSLTQNNYEK